MQILCKKCNILVEPEVTEQAHNGGSHMRADCPKCGKWIKWLPKMFAPKSTTQEESIFRRPQIEDFISKTQVIEC